MPVYHSKFCESAAGAGTDQRPLLVGNIALLPLKTSAKGPAPRMDNGGGDDDIIDEALLYYKPNIFFRNFEIKGAADRTLIYLFLYITECLKRVQKCPKKAQAQKELLTLALETGRKMPIPGDAAFPFPGLFKPPASPADEEVMRSYLQQLRQELGVRLVELVFPNPDGPPSKWWTCFARRRFMDKSLTNTY